MTRTIGTTLSAFARIVPGLLRDLAGLCGVGLVSYGAWLVYPPAGFIICGSLMITGALLLALGNRSAG